LVTSPYAGGGCLAACCCIVVLLLQCSLPGDAQEQKDRAREWVSRLGSAMPEEREEASRQLRKLGPVALAELEKAATAADSEIASRAKHLIGIIRIAESLPPRLRAALPGVEERLQEPTGWTQVFLGLLSEEDTPARPDRITAAELDVLAERALRGASSKVETQRILRAVQKNRLISATAEVALRVRHPDFDVAEWAVAAMASLGREEETPGGPADPPKSADSIGQAAARALAKASADTRLTQITRIMESSDPFVRQIGLEAAMRLADDRMVPRVLPLLRDRQEDVRKAAVQALGTFGKSAPTDALIQVLSDDSPKVRLAALRSLSAFDHRKAARPIRLLLKDPCGDIRQAAVETLTSFLDRESAPDIWPLLLDGRPEAQAAAAWALQVLQEPSVLPHVTRLLMDSTVSTRSLAAGVLAGLGAKDRVKDIEPLLNDPADTARASAVRALSELGAAQEKERTRRLLLDASPSVRSETARALALFPAADTVGLLKPLLKDEEGFVRASALGALTQLKARELSKEMAALLDDRDLHVRASAAEALGWLQAAEYIPHLRQMHLEDESSVPRRSAALALCMLGDPKVAASIISAELDLSYLNALRQPALWRKLQGIAGPESGVGTAAEVLSRAAAKSGLSLEWGMGAPGPPTPLTSKYTRFVNPRGQKSVLAALLETVGGHFSFVLEGRSMRIMTSQEGISFWREWAASLKDNR